MITAASILSRYMIAVTFDTALPSSVSKDEFYLTSEFYGNNRIDINSIHITDDRLTCHLGVDHMQCSTTYTVYSIITTGTADITYTGSTLDPKIVLNNKTPTSGATADPSITMSVDVLPQDTTVTAEDITVKINSVDMTNSCTITDNSDWFRVQFSGLDYAGEYTVQIIV